MAKGGRKNMFQLNICHCSATSYCTKVSNHFTVTIILLLASQRLLSCLHTSIKCVLFFLLIVLQTADCGSCAVRRTVVERYLTFEKQRFADFYCSKGQSATVKCKMHQSIILLTQHWLFANICWGTRSQACSIVDFISTCTCLYGGITVGTLKSLCTGFKPLFASC